MKAYKTPIDKKIVVKKIHATADFWELFDKPDRDRVADDLNAYFMHLVNAGNTRDDVAAMMEKFMLRYADWGAADTEGYYALLRLLNDVFGEEN